MVGKSSRIRCYSKGRFVASECQQQVMHGILGSGLSDSPRLNFPSPFSRILYHLGYSFRQKVKSEAIRGRRKRVQLH